jgi:hypothetical protein
VTTIYELVERLKPETFSDDPYYDGTLAAKSLLDRREVHLRRMAFNLRISVTSEPHGFYYEEEFCFHNAFVAWLAFHTWNGEGPPFGWAKNATTGERGPGFVEPQERAAL